MGTVTASLATMETRARTPWEPRPPTAVVASIPMGTVILMLGMLFQRTQHNIRTETAMDTGTTSAWAPQ